jgi:hypothetical protein
VAVRGKVLGAYTYLDADVTEVVQQRRAAARRSIRCFQASDRQYAPLVGAGRSARPRIPAACVFTTRRQGAGLAGGYFVGKRDDSTS